MKTLHVITDSLTHCSISKRLIEAAEKRNIIINLITTSNFDFSNETKLGNDDGLYRASCNRNAVLIEQHLLNDEVNSLYNDIPLQYTRVPGSLRDAILFQKAGLSYIPSFPLVTNDREILKKYSEILGNFPLVIKVSGSMRGLGTMRVDSFESLHSIADHLHNSPRTYYQLQKFIPHKMQVRLKILNNEILTSHANLRTTDFRTNRSPKEEREELVEDFSPEIQELGKEAMKVLGYEFGAVDILVDETTNKPYLAEVNMPCDFLYAEKLHDADIAGAIIDFMIKKSEKK